MRKTLEYPTMTRSGEAERVGLSSSFVGAYIGVAGAVTLLSVLAVPVLQEFMSLTDLMRICTALFAVVSAPQGFANLLASGPEDPLAFWMGLTHMLEQFRF